MLMRPIRTRRWRPRRRGRAGRAVLPFIAAAVGVVAVLPLIYLVLRAQEAGGGTIIDVLTASHTLEVLRNTVALTAAVTAGALALGAPLAWLTIRTTMPGRGVLTVLLALPLAFPSYVAGYAYVSFLGPRGLLQSWLEPLGVQRLPSFYGFGGAWLVLTLVSYPYVFLTVRAALRRLDPSAEEASRTLGHGAAATFRRVVLPGVHPALASGGLLVALYTLSDFGAVSMLRFDSFTRAIYVRYQASLDRSAAAALALALVALSLVVIAIEIRSRRAAGGALHAGSRPQRLHDLRRWRWPAVTFAGIVVLLGVAVPTGVISWWLVRGMRAGEPLRLTGELVVNSLQVSAWGGLAAVAAALPVALLAARRPGRGIRVIETASWTGYALPGVVVALALAFLGARHLPMLYQTIPMLVVAYVVMFLPQALGPIKASIHQVNRSWEDASRTLGRGPGATFRRVVLPLSRSGVLTGGALVFLTVMKELPATLMLAPTGFSTLATQVWSATTESFFGRAAAPALVLVLLSSVPVILLVTHDDARRSRRQPRPVPPVEPSPSQLPVERDRVAAGVP